MIVYTRLPSTARMSEEIVEGHISQLCETVVFTDRGCFAYIKLHPVPW